MPTGKVIRIPQGKNFGFIRYEKKDYFFHRDDFNGHWDDLVSDIISQEIDASFDIVDSIKGGRAGNVKRVDYPN